MVAGALVKVIRELDVRRVNIVLDLEIGFQNRTKTGRIVYDGLKTLTHHCNLYPLVPHFYIVNFRGIYLFLIVGLGGGGGMGVTTYISEYRDVRTLKVYFRNRRNEVILNCTHNLCFRAKILDTRSLVHSHH